MMKIRATIYALSAILVSGTAVAHDGMHLAAQTTSHLAAEPLLLSAVAGAVVLLAVRAIKRGGRPDEHSD